VILNIILATTLSFFVFLSGLLGARLITLRNDLSEFELRAALLEQGVKQALEKTPPAIENSEGFLRFVSESRDWAFDYIEEVQSGLASFVNEVGPLIDYFDNYGEAGPMGPNTDALRKISTEFKILKDLLPKDDQ
jgi:hypothetical protein